MTFWQEVALGGALVILLNLSILGILVTRELWERKQLHKEQKEMVDRVKKRMAEARHHNESYFED